jgi:predicted O-methyltransferase YrrM
MNWLQSNLHEVSEGAEILCYLQLVDIQQEWGKTVLETLLENSLSVKFIFPLGSESIVARRFSEQQPRFRDMQWPLATIITPRGLLFPEQEVAFESHDVSLKYREQFLAAWNQGEEVSLANEISTYFDWPMAALEVPISLQAQTVLTFIRRQEDTWQTHLTTGSEAGKSILKIEQLKYWSVEETTAKLLARLVAAKESPQVLEIGSSVGYSTIHLGIGAKLSGGSVRSFELLAKKSAQASSHVEAAELASIVRIEQGAALDLLETVQEKSLDLIFLDADQPHYHAYIDPCLKKLRPGGLLIADNIRDYSHLVAPYLDRLDELQQEGIVRNLYLPVDNGLMFSYLL